MDGGPGQAPWQVQKTTPFHGMSLSGKVVMTVCRGEIVYQDAEPASGGKEIKW